MCHEPATIDFRLFYVDRRGGFLLSNKLAISFAVSFQRNVDRSIRALHYKRLDVKQYTRHNTRVRWKKENFYTKVPYARMLL